MEVREIILDTETTGLSPNDGHRIVEIGAVEMINKIETGNEFNCYINPERNMPNEAYRVHGLSSEFLQDKPLFKDIAKDFLNFIGDSKIVIHNAPFDVKFLNHELSLVKLPSLDITNVIDTLVMSRKAFPGSRVNLDALCKRFKINNSSRDKHGALKDAILLSKVYIELTGGRQSSFIMNNKMSLKDNINHESNNVQSNKIVITPTDSEKQDHAIFLNSIYGK